ncbi:hypothetical protein ACLOJK_030030 [Asimina triloba]
MLACLKPLFSQISSTDQQGNYLQESAIMSFVFRGSRGDIESGIPGFIPERRAVRMHAGGRPVNTNSLAFLVTAASGLLGHTEFRLHMPPSIAFATRGRLHGLRLQLALLDREFDDLGILCTFCLMVASALGYVFLRACLRSRILNLLQLINVGDPDASGNGNPQLEDGLTLDGVATANYDALRALDSDNNPSAPSMSEEEINALPVHKYKVQSHHASPSGSQRQVLAVVRCGFFRTNEGSSLQQASSSAAMTEVFVKQKKQDSAKSDGATKSQEDELTCSVCLEQVSVGELIRSLPCLHQIHGCGNKARALYVSSEQVQRGRKVVRVE